MSTSKARLPDFVRIFLHHRKGTIGLAILVGLLLLFGIVPLIVHLRPIAINYKQILRPPSIDHLFGTDEYGRDIFSRVLIGGRVSLLASIYASLIAMAGGVSLGIVGGLFRRLTDRSVTFATMVLQTFPGFLLALVIVTAFGPSFNNILIGVGISFMPIFVRVSRGQTISVMSSDYVLGARAVGATNGHLVRSYILPGIAPTMIVLYTIALPAVLAAAAALSFLGLGVQPPQPELGAILSQSQGYMSQAWWYTFFPAFFLVLAVIAFTLVGDGLRDVLDPRFRA